MAMPLSAQRHPVGEAGLGKSSVLTALNLASPSGACLGVMAGRWRMYGSGAQGKSQVYGSSPTTPQVIQRDQSSGFLVHLLHSDWPHLTKAWRKQAVSPHALPRGTQSPSNPHISKITCGFLFVCLFAFAQYIFAQIFFSNFIPFFRYVFCILHRSRFCSVIQSEKVFILIAKLSHLY